MLSLSSLFCLRPRNLVLDFVEWLDRVAENASIVFLSETKESVDVTEKLLVIMTAVTMVIMMTTTASSKAKGDYILRSPRKVKLNDIIIGRGK
jgi:hypothetical protein